MNGSDNSCFGTINIDLGKNDLWLRQLPKVQGQKCGTDQQLSR